MFHDALPTQTSTLSLRNATPVFLSAPVDSGVFNHHPDPWLANPNPESCLVASAS